MRRDCAKASVGSAFISVALRMLCAPATTSVATEPSTVAPSAIMITDIVGVILGTIAPTLAYRVAAVNAQAGQKAEKSATFREHALKRRHV
jgi:hypothetical protein